MDRRHSEIMLERIAIVVAMCLVCGTPRGDASEGGAPPPPPAADEIRFHFEVWREELGKPIRTLQAKYEAALQRVGEAAQQEGNLEALLAVKREIAGFRLGDFPAEGAYPALLQAREIYEKELENVIRPVVAGEAKLREKLYGDLGDLRTGLTRESRLDEALRVSGLIDDLKLRKTLADEAWTGPDLFHLLPSTSGVTASGCRIEREDGGYLLELSQGFRVGSLSTDASFTPPFVAEWVVATDGGNLRFYYADFLAILNHESGRTAFQVRDPLVGKPSERMIPEIGRVTADEFHTIRLRVGRDSYSFVVGDEVKASGEGDYRALSAPVSIGPAYGSRLRLRSFRVYR